jgi:hypothetical protein
MLIIFRYKSIYGFPVFADGVQIDMSCNESERDARDDLWPIASGPILELEGFRVRRLVFPKLRQHWHLCRMNLDDKLIIR